MPNMEIEYMSELSNQLTTEQQVKLLDSLIARHPESVPVDFYSLII